MIEISSEYKGFEHTNDSLPVSVQHTSYTLLLSTNLRSTAAFLFILFQSDLKQEMTDTRSEQIIVATLIQGGMFTPTKMVST